jgi:hypothetical protein
VKRLCLRQAASTTVTIPSFVIQIICDHWRTKTRLSNIVAWTQRSHGSDAAHFANCRESYARLAGRQTVYSGKVARLCQPATVLRIWFYRLARCGNRHRGPVCVGKYLDQRDRQAASGWLSGPTTAQNVPHQHCADSDNALLSEFAFTGSLVPFAGLWYRIGKLRIRGVIR